MKNRYLLLWLLALTYLQGILWFGNGSMTEVNHLSQAIQQQTAANARLEEQNSRLTAEVADLKTGLDAIEEIARYDLIMTRKDETFYQIIEVEPEQ